MKRNIARFSALAGYLEMGDTAPFMFEVLDQQLAELFTPQGVIEQGGQNGTVTLILERHILGRVQ